MQSQTTVPQINPVEINGVKVYPFATKDQLVDYLLSYPGILVAINAEKIINATDQTRAIINANIGYCDGVGAVWAMSRRGHKHLAKIAGCELWLHIIERLYRDGTSFYIVGGKQEVLDKVIVKLKEDYPGINLAGYRNGYMDESEQDALVDDIAAKQPDVVFVAMGSPRQELLMGRMQQRHKAIYQGLGGSFDVYTGTAKRGPKWMLDHNLEFVYRMFMVPGHLKRGFKVLSNLHKLL